MYEELYTENQGLLIMSARRYRGLCERDRAVSFEDLIQSGFIGLMRAYKAFNVGEDGEKQGWAAFALEYIRNEMLKALGYQCHLHGIRKLHNDAIAIDAPMGEDGDISIGDIIADDSLPDMDAGLLLSDLQREVREAVERLDNERYREAVKLCDLEGKTQTEVAAAWGISIASVNAAVRNGHRKLKEDSFLRKMYGLEMRTNYYRKKGLNAFNSTGSSVVEDIAFQHMEAMDRIRKKERSRLDAERRQRELEALLGRTESGVLT